MSEARRARLVPLLLLAATLLVYLPFLSRVPAYLSHDEVVFSLSAHSIASTGRDITGRRFPLFFEINSQFWATPVVVYATAIVLKAFPLTETVIRAQSVIVGALDVVLTYLLGLRIFRSARLGILAAVLLALTPAHFIHSRMAVDLLYPVPFLLASLLSAVTYMEGGDRRLLFLATTILAIGCYTYVGAAASMPLYFLLVVGMIATRDERPLRAVGIAVMGFVWPLVPVVPWLMRHPTQLTGQVQMYHVYDPTKLNALQGLRELLSYTSLGARTNVYYEFFNPSFLFLSGDSSLMNSTRAAGVLLLPLAIFMPAGINHIVNRDRRPTYVLLAIGLALAPVAALLVVEVKINRALVMLPFAAMIAALGVDVMAHARRAVWRYVAVALLAAIPLQFGYFYRDYMTAYRVRSAFWFERNKRAAFEDILARDRTHPVPRIYISRTPRWIDWYWTWYLAKAGRSDLLARTIYTVPAELDLAGMPPHSVVFGEAEEVEAAPVFRRSARAVARIAEPDGAISFIVFER